MLRSFLLSPEVDNKPYRVDSETHCKPHENESLADFEGIESYQTQQIAELDLPHCVSPKSHSPRSRKMPLKVLNGTEKKNTAVRGPVKPLYT